MNIAYGGQCPSRSAILFWVAEFTHERKNVSDEAREGRPLELTSQHSEEMEELIRESQR